MLLEVRTVGRKTPGDGKLEIAATTARCLQGAESPFPLEVGTRRDAATVVTLTCSKCARAAAEGGPHEHWFVESPILRDLTVGDTWALELTEGGILRLVPPPVVPDER